MNRILVSVFVCALLLIPAVSGAGRREALEAYRALDMKTAVALFQEAASADAGNAELHAWLALAQRRSGSWDDALASGKRALELDGESSFAHAVLGRVYNPQYSSADGTDADKSWQHLTRAVELDNSNGDAWSIVWTEAMRRGEEETEQRALAALLDTGFYPPCVMNYARWTLEQLPRNALLLTNGDLDTYPMAALQSARGVRPDVAIVNMSLLNLDWYIELMCKRHALPVPASDIEAMRPKKDDEGAWVLISRQVAEAWRGMTKSGDLQRPMAVAVTVPMGMVWPEVGDEYTVAGAYFQLEGTGEADIARLEMSLAMADALDFGGPTRNPIDTSPLRDGSGVLMNITAAALQLAQAYLDADRAQDAYDTVLWAERFEETSSTKPLPSLAGYKEKAQNAVGEKKGDD